MTEPELKKINKSFERMKKQNLNHNPKCPYAFEVELPDNSIMQAIEEIHDIMKDFVDVAQVKK